MLLLSSTLLKNKMDNILAPTKEQENDFTSPPKWYSIIYFVKLWELKIFLYMWICYVCHSDWALWCMYCFWRMLMNVEPRNTDNEYKVYWVYCVNSWVSHRQSPVWRVGLFSSKGVNKIMWNTVLGLLGKRT